MSEPRESLMVVSTPTLVSRRTNSRALSLVEG